jgi:hypothetical protein
MRQRGFAPLIVILLLLLVMVGGFLLLYKYKLPSDSQKQSPSPNTLNTQSTTDTNRLALSLKEIVDKFPANNYRGEVTKDDPYGTPEKVNTALNYDRPNEMRHYENKELGISIELPYNSNWGTKDFKPTAYDESLKEDKSVAKVTFGPIIAGCDGDCFWMRQYSISLDKKQTIDEFTKALDKQIGSPGAPYTLTGYTKDEVNGVDVLKVTTNTEEILYYVFGEKYIYLINDISLNPYSVGFMKDDSDVLWKSVQTVKLID